MEDLLPRKLAVILHADVIDSTALVQINDAIAHERIRDVFDRLSDVVTAYGGIAHEIRGDALVAEFDKASDCVSAALSFQEANSDLNATLGDEIQPRLRIGIGMGEVVVADGTVTGAGVVLAQRLEQLANADGVCVQGAARETVPNHLAIQFSDLGEQKLKGFDIPVRVYEATPRPGESVPAPGPRGRAAGSHGVSTAWRWAAGAAGITAIVIGAVLVFSSKTPPADETAASAPIALKLPDKPSIAVLPFTNLSDDPEQEYFADGMTDDIITDLSKLRELFVISRHTTFAYKGRAEDIRHIGRQLGVRHVLEGSVRHAANDVRINAQLIDVTSGGHVWAERYAGTNDELFALQDAIVARIVKALASELLDPVSSTRRSAATENPDAYDAFLRGMHHYRKGTPEQYDKAIEHLSRAVALDPEFIEAHAVLAGIYLRSSNQRFFRDLGLEHFEAWKLAKKHLAVAMRAPTSTAYRVASRLSLIFRRHNEAIEQAREAISGNPNDAEAHATLAFALIMGGLPDEAAASIDTARRLDPHNEYYYAFLQGLTEFNREAFDAAARSFEKALALNPELWSKTGGYGCGPDAPLVSTYAHLGRDAAARALVEKGHYSCSVDAILSASWPFKESRDVERLGSGLRMAGVAER